MRTSEKQINSILQKQVVRLLAQAVADIREYDTADIVLRDFFTGSELTTFSKRLAVAYWLKKGRSYNNIKENLKVSSATVASVQRNMEKEGFVELIRQVEAEEFANEWRGKIKKYAGV